MCECNEDPCWCEGGYDDCGVCGKRTSYKAEWDDEIWLCLACSGCDLCNGRKAVGCDACGGDGVLENRRPHGSPDYHQWDCGQCEGTGRVDCPKCCTRSKQGRDAASREDAAVSRYEARLEAANAAPDFYR